MMIPPSIPADDSDSEDDDDDDADLIGLM